MLLGCVADDLTGATDLALMLVRGGMRTVQIMNVPATGDALPEADAIVVALKSRTIPADEAVAMSVASAKALQAAGARQLFFKYCSTFDSTDAGNIGPVGDALLDLCGGGIAIACPAFPANGRTVYQGHLFVGRTLLSNSPLRDHPLTPMTDPDLVAVLSRQTARTVGLVPYETVAQGATAVRTALDDLKSAAVSYAIVDAITDEDLYAIGAACADLPLLTGGSGVAIGLPENFRQKGWLPVRDPAADFTPAKGSGLILAGSNSAATRAQIENAKAAGIPARQIDPERLADGDVEIAAAAEWAAAELSETRPVLIYSSDDPAVVARIQEKMGREAAGALVERAFSELAVRLVDRGVGRLIVAGGETSGAVVNGLGIKALDIGPEIAPGVPWTTALDRDGLVLALKSGNFGGPDFFKDAWKMVA